MDILGRRHAERRASTAQHDRRRAHHEPASRHASAEVVVAKQHDRRIAALLKKPIYRFGERQAASPLAALPHRHALEGAFVGSHPIIPGEQAVTGGHDRHGDPMTESACGVYAPHEANVLLPSVQLFCRYQRRRKPSMKSRNVAGPACKVALRGAGPPVVILRPVHAVRTAMSSRSGVTPPTSRGRSPRRRGCGCSPGW